MSAKQAECAALASISFNGLPLLDSVGSGVAVGYGRVSVALQLTTATPTTSPVRETGTDHNTTAKLPKPTSYQQRLAWLIVVRDNEEFFGGGPISVHSPSKPTTTTTPAPPTYGYLVFVVDARTGSDALLYTESQPGPIVSSRSASVTVPAEQVSVPWALKSRSPNGYTGQITATVLPCDGVPNPVSVDSGRAALTVVVERPVGANCGAPQQVTVGLNAAVVTFNLPAHIAHNPLGPYVARRADSTAGYSARCPQTQINGRPIMECFYNGPGATGGVLRTLFEPDNGSTIPTIVGSVFAVGPLHDATHYAALPVTSSDPAVLGVLFPDPEVHEFRAWHTGHADLYVPTSACNPSTGKGMPCTPPWIVHINIK